MQSNKLTSTQSAILADLKANGTLRYVPLSLIKKYCVKQTELNKAVKEMIRMGLIEKEVNKMYNNGRYTTISILKIK